MFQLIARRSFKSKAAAKKAAAAAASSGSNSEPWVLRQFGQNISDGDRSETTTLEPFSTFLTDGPASYDITLTRREGLAYYAEMAVVRRVELVSDALYKEKAIRGFLHLATGEEAISTGSCAALSAQDHVITAYRDHGWYISRGGSAYECIAELLGRTDGASGGKGGSMHLYSGKGRFYGGNGIVGAQVPVGAGIAFASQYNKLDEVTLSIYGDGAANQGQVFEAFNMAALWKLPALFMVENNKYAMGTSVDRSTLEKRYHTRGAALAIPGMHFNGMDVLATRLALQHARAFALESGPMVLEAETYRYSGHSLSDPGLTYRTRDEVRQVRERRDPIANLRRRLIDMELSTEAELKEIDAAARADVDKAVEKAKACPQPAMSKLFAHMYAGPYPESHLYKCEVPTPE